MPPKESKVNKDKKWIFHLSSGLLLFVSACFEKPELPGFSLGWLSNPMVCPCLGGGTSLSYSASSLWPRPLHTPQPTVPPWLICPLLFFPAPLENLAPLLLKQRKNRKRITHSHLRPFPSGGEALSEGSEMAWNKTRVGTLQERGLSDVTAMPRPAL